MKVEEKSQAVKLYVVEEQKILNNIYEEVFSPLNSIHMVGLTNNVHFVPEIRAIKTTNPDVLLFSVKRLDQSVVDDLKQIRLSLPDAGLVISFFSYDSQQITVIRKLSSGTGCGLALLLKQTLDRPEQLCSVIKAVREGQVILDYMITDLIFAQNEQGPIKELTPRELRIIDLIAKGHTNSNIAKALYIDIRTVQHHINNIYSKLKEDPEFNNGHPRVNAARIFLETTGELVTSGSKEF